jgi:iron complex outermembrane receptor protein
MPAPFPLAAVRHPLLLATLLAPSLLPAAVPPAGTPANSPPLHQLPAVEVTGTRLGRPLAESPAPSVVITRAEIERSGRTSLAHLLLDYPEFPGGAVTDAIAISSVHGVSGANLRGLGEGNTLVLVDGRRTVAAANTFGDTVFVDLNRLPPALVERVEVLKGGASAVYGADAVAGVVNIVTRRRASGGELALAYGNSFSTDTAELSAGLVAAATRDRLSVAVTADLLDRHALAHRDRDFSRTTNLAPRFAATYATFAKLPPAQLAGYDGRSLTAPNARITLVPGQINGAAGINISGLAPGAQITALPGTGGTAAGTLALAVPNYTAPAVAPTGGVFSPAVAATFVVPEATRTDPAARNLYNFNDTMWLIPAAQRLGAGVRFDYTTRAGPAFFGHAHLQRNRSQTEFLPAGITAPVPAAQPWNPFGVAVTAQWRLAELGARRSLYADTTSSLLAGLRGTVARRFDWEVAGSWGHNDYSDTTVNAASNTRVRAALATLDRTAALNPFGGASFRHAPALLDSVRIRPWTAGTSTLAVADARVSGDVIRTPAGPVRAAAYTDTRRERLVATSDPVQRSGDVLGQGVTGADTDRSRRVAAVAAEVIAPLLPARTAAAPAPLVIEAASRWESASGGFRSGARPSAGLVVRPHASLLLRASLASSFRAPTLPQLFAPQSEGFVNSIPDPRRPAALTGDDFDGPNVSRLVRGGGNPNLGPETGRARQFGVVWSPRSAPGLTLEAGWFRYDLEDLIATVGTGYVLDNELGGLGYLVVRQPGTETYVNRTASPIRVLTGPAGTFTTVAPGASATVPGRLVRIDSYTVNLSRRRLVGSDFTVRYAHTVADLGRFEAHAALTYTDQNSTAFDQATPLVDGASGNFRWRARGGLDWSRGPWHAGATMSWTASHGKHPELSYRKAYRPVNLHAGWTAPRESWLRGTRFTVGLDDIFNESVPLYPDPPIGYNAYLISRPQQRFWRIAATRTW